MIRFRDRRRATGPSTLLLLCALAALPVSCGSTARSTDAPAPPPPAASGADTQEASASPAERAESHADAARALFAEGDPSAALVEVDRALEIAPGRQDLLLARADGLVLLGAQFIAQQANGVYVVSAFEDALRAYDDCEPSPRALLGRARAAYQLGRGVAAWEAASAARDLASESGAKLWTPLVGAPDDEEQGALEVLATSAYLAYAERADGRAGADSGAPDFDTAFELVARFVGANRDRADAWNTLANLHLYRSVETNDVADTRRALEAVRTGLEHLPEDETLRPRLTELAQRVGGPSEVASVSAAYADRYPDSPSARFEAAKALFDLGLAEFPGPDAAADASAIGRGRFERADQWFARVSEIEATLEEPVGWDQAAMGWRAVARIAHGWVDYYAGDADAAERWFLSANDVFARGIEWSIEGQLQSGIQGLFQLSTDAVAGGDLAEGARLADLVTELVPTDGNFANNAGFLNRDLAVAIELEGRELMAAGDDDAARERFARALEIMERSAAAYARAAELLPDDVRVINDAALVHVYYLHTELDRAEELLLRAVELGASQLEADDLPADERPILTEAWGDAHENLGVLWLEHEGDADVARTWFERAVEIGPNPRPMITQVWFARPEFGDDAATGPTDHTILDWARPGE
ncbi:hypothetical protein Pla163_30760 [Planctomycetes bacterium Pla163]|uniref:Tetratricopeptide repeat protein n=1 Tax=Rohdeia mirabilis TaxID=2528008 RepID=A0A518D390_9BACT|nr:hypothetical protein Pla163_30760 [Planctomycetes bacterium Pla163]